MQNCKFRYIIYGDCTLARKWARSNPGVRGYSFECYIASIPEQVTLCQQIGIAPKGFFDIQTIENFKDPKTQHHIASEKKELQAIVAFEAKF